MESQLFNVTASQLHITVTYMFSLNWTNEILLAVDNLPFFPPGHREERDDYDDMWDQV